MQLSPSVRFQLLHHISLVFTNYLIDGQCCLLSMGVGRIFSREGPIMDFSGVGKKNFAEGAKVAHFHFNHSKLRK